MGICLRALESEGRAIKGEIQAQGYQGKGQGKIGRFRGILWPYTGLKCGSSRQVTFRVPVCVPFNKGKTALGAERGDVVRAFTVGEPNDVILVLDDQPATTGTQSVLSAAPDGEVLEDFVRHHNHPSGGPGISQNSQTRRVTPSPATRTANSER
jgi:hypothetical protein